MPRAVTAKGVRTRRRILALAESLFAERGYYGCSVRDVATAAAMPNASLLHYFPSKERLYAAVLEEIAAEVDALAAPVLALPAADPAAALRAFVAALLAWAERAPQRVSLLLRELLDNRARLGEQTRLFLAPFVHRVEAFVADGIERGVFHPVEPALVVVHLAGSLSYYLASRPTMARILGRREEDLDAAYAPDLTALVERALVRAPAPGGTP